MDGAASGRRLLVPRRERRDDPGEAIADPRRGRDPLRALGRLAEQFAQ